MNKVDTSMNNTERPMNNTERPMNNTETSMNNRLSPTSKSSDIETVDSKVELALTNKVSLEESPKVVES